MKTLTLLRHAKSDWSDQTLRDFDRPINERGVRGATEMGRYLTREAPEIGTIIASPAVRSAETLEVLGTTWTLPASPVWDRRIYLASSPQLMDVVATVSDEYRHIMVVGHNPGLEEMIFDLVMDDGASPLLDEVEEKFPTCSLATLELAIAKWADITDRCGKLVRFVRPRDLDPALGPEARI